MSELFIGGATFTTGHLVDYNMNIAQKWQSTNPYHLQTTTARSSGQIAIQWNLHGVVVEALREMHEAMLERILEEYGRPKITKPDWPVNYTQNMILVKNLKVPGVDKLKGFCPFEPLVRVNMLIDFYGADKFDDFAKNIAQIKDIPYPVDVPVEGPVWVWLQKNKHILQEWENYYTEVAQILSNFRGGNFVVSTH